MEKKITYQRLWEVDSVRGIAIIMMVLSNFLFDLYLFLGYSEFYSGFWIYFARLTASLFILIAGVSLTLSYSRVMENSRKEILVKYFKRGLKIFGIGLVITAVSWFVVGEDLVIFGILHLIGLSIIVSYPFLRLKFLNLFFGTIIILIGFLFQNVFVSYPWLVWLGLKYSGFNSIDYVPVFPWFGFFLAGIFLGNLFYKRGERTFAIKDLSKTILTRFLTRLGRNSLLIYLIHQPVFVGLILLYSSLAF